MSTPIVEQIVPSKLSRQERKQRTRQRLISAVIDIVGEEGIEALTTTRLTKHAEITQPGFYVHFKNIDHCLSIAAEQIQDRLNQLQSGARKRAYEQLNSADDLRKADLVSSAFEEMLSSILSEPHLSKIFLRYRHDPSPLGESMRKVIDQARQDVTEDALRIARKLNVPARYHSKFGLWAELLMSLFLGALEALIEERCSDRALMIETLTRFTRASVMAEITNASGF